jgi:lipopolysaccharide export system permease protein
MGLFSRYLFRQVVAAILLILSSLTGVVWIATALKQLNIVTSQGGETAQFLQMTVLAIPNLMAIIAPLALLIAGLHVLNRLNADSELIVMSASGATIWTFARPLLLVAAVVSVAVLIVNAWVMPYSARRLTEMIVHLRTDLIGQVLQPGRFSSPEKGLTFHIRDRDQNSGRISGLIVHDSREAKQQISYLAESGDILKQGKSAYLVMNAGHIIRQTDASHAPQIIKFDRYVFDLLSMEPKDVKEALRPREYYLGELWSPPSETKSSPRATLGKLRAELHDRLASALYPFAFAMIAIAGVGVAQTTRQSRTANLIGAFAAAVGLRIAGFGLTNVIAINPAAAPLAYALPIGAALVAGLVATRRAWPRRRRQLWGPSVAQKSKPALPHGSPA